MTTSCLILNVIIIIKTNPTLSTSPLKISELDKATPNLLGDFIIATQLGMPNLKSLDRLTAELKLSLYYSK